MGRAAQTRAKESIKGGSARRGQVRRVHLTLSAEPWLKTRRTECVIPLDIVASTSQNEAAVMVQGVVVFVPGTYRTTLQIEPWRMSLLLTYYGMPFDFYTWQVNSVYMCVSKNPHLCGKGVGMVRTPQALGATALGSVSSLL